MQLRNNQQHLSVIASESVVGHHEKAVVVMELGVVVAQRLTCHTTV